MAKNALKLKPSAVRIREEFLVKKPDVFGIPLLYTPLFHFAVLHLCYFLGFILSEKQMAIEFFKNSDRSDPNAFVGDNLENHYCAQGVMPHFQDRWN
jgi:hypothetical protein